MKHFFLLLLISLSGSIYSQSISGFVLDENNAPVPFANIYIKSSSIGTSTDGDGKYTFQFTNHGIYTIVVRAIGFETQEFSVTIEGNNEVVKNIWLKTDVNKLKEFEIKSKGRDPAYGIIKNAIENKVRWNTQIKSSKCEVYIKAKEVISEKERKKRERRARQRKRQEEIEEKTKEKTDEELFDEAEKNRKREIFKLAGSINMMEVKMERHYQAPNKVKEIRSAYKEYGNSFGLFFKNTIQNEFNFYDNLMNLYKLNEVPLVSPLNSLSVLTYKFKLIETTFDEGVMIFKIEVTPRKKGNATWEGFIWIRDNSYNIDKVDLSLHKGGLLRYNDFRIQQEYSFNEDSVLLTYKQVFDYVEKSGRTSFTGQTTVVYSDYELDVTFPKRYFGNEVGITSAEAYERDTSYWGKIRPQPLTKEEQRFQIIKDSIREYLTSPAYLDSVDSVYNKVTFLDVAWNGVGFRNRAKKQSLWFGSVPTFIRFDPVNPLRLGPMASYFKRFENERTLNISGNINQGLKNKDIKGNFRIGTKYDPMHLGRIDFYAGKRFDLLVFDDALFNKFQRNNWIETGYFLVRTSRELFNGFYSSLYYSFDNRSSISGYTFTPVFDSIFPGEPNVAGDFDGYKSSRVGIGFSYTPFQKYMLEPKRKVVLGSKWPTFTLRYEKGVNGLLGSSIDYDQLTAEIQHTFKVRTLGTSSYRMEAGKFLSKKELKREDNRIFGRSDQWFFASFLTSMQLQDTTLNVTDSYLKFNYIHHFNGAIMDKIPVINKLKLQLVAGAAAFFIEEEDYKNVDVMALQLQKLYPKFSKEDSGFKAISCYRLEIFEGFYSVVVTILKNEHEMESLLINYNLNGEIIDSKVVSYDEIAEGQSQIESKIENIKYGVMYQKYNALLYSENSTTVSKAIKIAEQEIAERPTTQSYDLLAWYYYHKKEYKKALEVMKSYVVGKTFEPEAHYHLAEIYKANGFKKRALKIKNELYYKLFKNPLIRYI